MTGVTVWPSPSSTATSAIRPDVSTDETVPVSQFLALSGIGEDTLVAP